MGVICRTLITSSSSYLISDLLPLFFLTDIYHIYLFNHITFVFACHTLSFLLQSLKALLIYEQISVSFLLLWTQAPFSNDFRGWYSHQPWNIISFTIRNEREVISLFSIPVYSPEFTTTWSSLEHLIASLCLNAFIFHWHDKWQHFPFQHTCRTQGILIIHRSSVLPSCWVIP